MKLSEDFSLGSVAGIPFAVTELESAVDWTVARCASKQDPQPIRFANAWCVVLGNRDPIYNEVLTGPGLNFSDGKPISWILRLTGHSASARVRGPSFFERVLDVGRESGLRHYFIGGTPSGLDRMLFRIHEKYPGADVAGAVAPPFAPVSDYPLDSWAEDIRLSEASIVWVGLGTPKQDIVTQRLTRMSRVHCAGVGAAFQFLSGEVKEAPAWAQRAGLEWLHRLASEPRRLWKRYLIGNVQFLYYAVKWAVHE